MKIFVPAVVEGQEWILPDLDGAYAILDGLNGARQTHWRPQRMDLLRRRDDGSPRQYSDFPWGGAHLLFVKPRALSSLRPSLEAYGEFLPLLGADGVSLFSVTTVADALDTERSKIVRFDDGSILDIERHAFRPEAIGSAEVFKLPEHVVRVSSIYLQESIVRRIGELGLTGIAFEMVWSDEPGLPAPARIEYSRPETPGRDPDRGLFRRTWDRLRGRRP